MFPTKSENSNSIQTQHSCVDNAEWKYSNAESNPMEAFDSSSNNLSSHLNKSVCAYVFFVSIRAVQYHYDWCVESMQYA